jgi:hypothetical protein
MKYAVKVTIHVNGRSGTKFVTTGRGAVEKRSTRAAAERLVAKCASTAITGVRETYQIVEVR